MGFDALQILSRTGAVGPFLGLSQQVVEVDLVVPRPHVPSAIHIQVQTHDRSVLGFETGQRTDGVLSEGPHSTSWLTCP